jgi:uncharacterized protein involved in exopolysaccharide biosynthesis
MSTLFARLLAKRWWILASVVVFTGAFGVIAFMMTPIYRASIILAPAAADRGADVVGAVSSTLGGLASIAGLPLGPRDAGTEEAIAVLQSREFTEKFIIDKNLLPVLFASAWNTATGTWKVPDDKQPTTGRAYKYFDKKIRTVTEDPKTGLVTMQIDWTDRNEAADWANELVQRLNEEMRARAVTKADASMSFLNKESQTTSTLEVQSAISRLIESTVKQRMLANVTRDYSFRVVDRAIAPDKDDIVKPQKALLLLVGALLGLIVGVVPVFLFGSRGGAV